MKFNKETLASIIRAALTILTTLTAFGVLNVPFIDSLVAALNELMGGLEGAWGAGEVIVTLIMSIVAQFVDTANGTAKTVFMSAKRFDYRDKKAA